MCRVVTNITIHLNKNPSLMNVQLFYSSWYDWSGAFFYASLRILVVQYNKKTS